VPRRERKRLPGPWRIDGQKGDPGLRTISGKIGLLPFLRAVQEAGLPKKEAYRVLTVLQKLRNLDKCDRNDEFFALLERSTNRVKAFEYAVSKEEIYQAREGAGGLLRAKKLELHVERAQVTGALQATGGRFADDAVRGGFEPQIDKALDKALEGHLSLQQLDRGDMLRVIAQEVTVLGEFSRYAGVEAVEYRPSDGEGLRVYYFRGPKSRGYYDQRGRALYEGGWRKPIKDAPITSRFNPKRLHPVLKKVMPHTGTDFGAPAGTPVGASSFGTVSFIGFAGPSGNLVKIEHPGGVETGYAHLQRFSAGLKVGDKVKRMQIIGYVGSTGRSTGPHLHFSAKRGGEFIDPETLNFDAMRVLPAEERELFAETRKKYDGMLDSIALPAPVEPARPPASVAAGSPDVGDEPDLGEEETAPVAAVAAAPANPAPLPAKPAAAPAVARPATPAVYLSDKELLKLQGASDDGEIED
jgi:murein DD-endopeptidase MepM/ murein hydrolase activator NlpD